MLLVLFSNSNNYFKITKDIYISALSHLIITFISLSLVCFLLSLVFAEDNPLKDTPQAIYVKYCCFVHYTNDCIKL